MKIGLLISGKLGLKALEASIQKHKVGFVLTNKASSDIISFCENALIPFFIGNPRNGNCTDFLKEKKVDVIASINYLFLIEDDIISKAKKAAFNIHGSLLPKYRGRTPHVWAIINGESHTGITAHLIDKSCDTGDILFQKKIKIHKKYTGNDILNIFLEEYIPIYEKVLNQIEKGTLEIKSQDSQKATYYGKRTPQDGQINWNWQKNRIYNWVRAQSNPYPGAFCFYSGEKIVVDEVLFSEVGYDADLKNGTILKIDHTGMPHVKTPNGALKLSKLRTSFKFTKGEILE